ncbi:MAG: flavodoxin family protein [Dehalococcoidia bacterium]|nr:MAG: flavodoxin family protein [Dehalococcoidia bacterium]
MLEVLGIGGSPRKGGNSDILLKYILKGARDADAKTEVVQLRDYQFQGCIGCEKCRTAEECIGLRDAMVLIYPKIMQSKGLVLISPTHNYNVTALMKAFIDRLYCYYSFSKERPGSWSSSLAGQGRKAIIACIGEQPDKESGIGFTLDAMRLPIEALGYELIGEIPVLGIFDKLGIQKQSSLLDKAESWGNKLANQLKMIQ